MARSNICVVIMGDIGRSPRMMYHCISLAREGHIVDIVGYRGVTPLKALTEQPLVSFHYLNHYPESLPLPKFINYALKAIWQAITLLFLMMIIRKPNYILVQNPPAVPTLFICYICKVILRCKLVIDWHNYAYTIMAMSCGMNNPLVKFTKYMERFFGQRADYNICVTNAMKQNLKDVWQIYAATLYDRPPNQFKPISTKEKHEIFVKLGSQYPLFVKNNEIGKETLFTKQVADEICLKSDRPGLLVSSTSWTQDEDFSILLHALQDYENTKSKNLLNLPPLICIITGKGDLKEHYCNIIKEKKWQHVTVITPWLEAADYPSVLASADLGVSLHTSSSGLDLPMKVVDLFGCCVPVCAYNFPCLDELVKHNQNSYVFNNKEELSQMLLKWFTNFPNDENQNKIIKGFKDKLEQFQRLRWDENWKQNVSNYFI